MNDNVTTSTTTDQSPLDSYRQLPPGVRRVIIAVAFISVLFLLAYLRMRGETTEDEVQVVEVTATAKPV